MKLLCLPQVSLRRATVALLAVGAGAAAHTSWADGLTDIAQRGVVRVGYVERIPFSYAPYKGAVDGYSVEICQKIIDALREETRQPALAVEFVELAPNALQTSLSTGRIDMECSATTTSEANRLGLAYAVPVYFASSQLLVPAASPVKRLSDLTGKTIAVVAGGPHEGLLQGQNGKYKIKPVATMAAAFASARAGQVDAILGHDVALQVQLKLDPTAAKWQVLEQPITIDTMSIVMRANEPRLKKVADAQIRRLMAEGEILDLHKKWFMSPLLSLTTPLNLRMSTLMRAHIRSPSEYVPTIKFID